MFKVSYFLEVLPIIASKVNITFELTIAATIFALIVGVIIAIIGYYKIPVLYQLTRVYVSIMPVPLKPSVTLKYIPSAGAPISARETVRVMQLSRISL